MIPSCLGEGKPLSDFHLKAFAIRNEPILTRDQIAQIINLTVKYIMELSKLKNIQQYTTSFELEFRRFECQPKRNQRSIIFTPKIEEIFETVETADIDMNPSH